jgi:hypothetical protein
MCDSSLVNSAERTADDAHAAVASRVVVVNARS